jgi:hypothetical protein
MRAVQGFWIAWGKGIIGVVVVIDIKREHQCMTWSLGVTGCGIVSRI